ncbi:hypothetical protein C8F04DRAFT_1183814 [Mycena alexandri]|uniref:Uncharacterized protein n=1 Tax=Mycena alexandri TaxID=1745969 RepID=A0AAD6SUU7_9AGAR|nr:hypothetical protein C8F04DRAFT_1183814 [Mycena alexandri]
MGVCLKLQVDTSKYGLERRGHTFPKMSDLAGIKNRRIPLEETNREKRQPAPMNYLKQTSENEQGNNWIACAKRAKSSRINGMPLFDTETAKPLDEGRPQMGKSSANTWTSSRLLIAAIPGNVFVVGLPTRVTLPVGRNVTHLRQWKTEQPRQERSNTYGFNSCALASLNFVRWRSAISRFSSNQTNYLQLVSAAPAFALVPCRCTSGVASQISLAWIPIWLYVSPIGSLSLKNTSAARTIIPGAAVTCRLTE